jgi:hypothetical protein
MWTRRIIFWSCLVVGAIAALASTQVETVPAFSLENGLGEAVLVTRL